MKGDVFVNNAIRSFCISLLVATIHSAHAEPIPVHYAQGSSHGFVTLEPLEGRRLQPVRTRKLFMVTGSRRDWSSTSGMDQSTMT